MKKIKIDKKKFLLKLLENFSSSSNLDNAISNTLSQMKIGKDRIEEVRSELLPNGFKSLMLEVNEIINQKIRSEKLPRNFTNFRTHEKVIYFVMRRLEIFNEILDKYKFRKLRRSLWLIFFKFSFNIILPNFPTVVSSPPPYTFE